MVKENVASPEVAAIHQRFRRFVETLRTTLGTALCSILQDLFSQIKDLERENVRLQVRLRLTQQGYSKLDPYIFFGSPERPGLYVCIAPSGFAGLYRCEEELVVHSRCTSLVNHHTKFGVDHQWPIFLNEETVWVEVSRLPQIGESLTPDVIFQILNPHP